MAELAALGVALPETARKEVAMVGEWETVSVEKAEGEREREERLRKESEKREEERKRRFEEMDVDERAVKGFRLRERKYPGEEEVDGDFMGAFKKIKRGMKLPGVEVKSEAEAEVKTEEVAGVKFEVKTQELREHTPVGLKRELQEGEGDVTLRPECEVKKEEREAVPGLEGEVKKEEDQDEGIPASVPAEVEIKKEEDATELAPEQPAEPVLFKKRKTKTMRKK